MKWKIYHISSTRLHQLWYQHSGLNIGKSAKCRCRIIICIHLITNITYEIVMNKQMIWRPSVIIYDCASRETLRIKSSMALWSLRPVGVNQINARSCQMVDICYWTMDQGRCHHIWMLWFCTVFTSRMYLYIMIKTISVNPSPGQCQHNLSLQTNIVHVNVCFKWVIGTWEDMLQSQVYGRDFKGYNLCSVCITN